MTEYLHIRPRAGGHNDTGRASDCPCEPEIRLIHGVPWLRVAVHRGVGVARLEAELRMLTHAYRVYGGGTDA